jgi:hypothetical protein
MSLENRLLDLMKLKENGLVSESEFEQMVAAARIEFAVPSTFAPPEEISVMTETISDADAGRKSFSPKKALAVVGVLVLLLTVGVVVARDRNSDPTKSGEYKDLVQTQISVEESLAAARIKLEEIESENAELSKSFSSQIEELEDSITLLKDEAKDWADRAENNRQALLEIEGLK